MIVLNFISEAEEQEIVQFARSYQPAHTDVNNQHIKSVNDHLKGYSILKDMTETPVSSYLAKYQGDNTVVQTVPDIFYQIKDRIADTLKISKDHVYFQVGIIRAGGEVRPHYDAGMPGYVTYKCNVAVIGPAEDKIYIDKSHLTVQPRCLYAFEASLYKHWAEKCDCDRVLLSYGFMLPYQELGWTEDAPRIRLSKRIWAAFIKG